MKEFGVDPTSVVCSSWEVKLGKVEMRLTAGMVEDLGPLCQIDLFVTCHSMTRVTQRDLRDIL